MRGTIAVTALLVGTLATMAFAPMTFAPGGSGNGKGIDGVRWLAGCWTGTSPSRTVEEQWMAPRARSMLGMGRTIRRDSLVEYEVVVLREDGDRLAYEAHPSGQPAATFHSIELTDTSVVFENPTHDFPQRVAYRLGAPDSLFAWIEGRRGDRTVRVEFPMRRASCGA